jgi:uncharacterized protein YbjT (DUF2867 family)
MADRRLGGIAAEDIGACAYGIFKRPELAGKRVGVAGEHLTGAEMAAAFSRVVGEPVEYQAVPHDVYRKLGFPGAEDLGNMFQFYVEFEQHFAASRDPAFARSLHPGLQRLEPWLEKNKARLLPK